MQRTGSGAAAAADHFFPGVSPEQRDKLAQKFRAWRSRAGLVEATPQRAQFVPGDDDLAPSRIIVEPRHLEPGRLDRIPFLERQLARAEAVVEQVLATGNVGRYSQAERTVSEIRQDLDIARGQSRPVKVDENPAAVVERMQERDKRIRQLAAARQAAKERDL